VLARDTDRIAIWCEIGRRAEKLLVSVAKAAANKRITIPHSLPGSNHDSFASPALAPGAAIHARIVAANGVAGHERVLDEGPGVCSEAT
jgi:hypothetical protein